MSGKEIKNVVASVLARLRNNSKSSGAPFQQVLQQLRAVSTFDGSVFTIFDGRRGAPQELRVLFVPGTHRRECKNAHNA
jgi:hypothetical protein